MDAINSVVQQAPFERPDDVLAVAAGLPEVGNRAVDDVAIAEAFGAGEAGDGPRAVVVGHNPIVVFRLDPVVDTDGVDPAVRGEFVADRTLSRPDDFDNALLGTRCTVLAGCCRVTSEEVGAIALVGRNFDRGDGLALVDAGATVAIGHPVEAEPREETGNLREVVDVAPAVGAVVLGDLARAVHEVESHARREYRRDGTAQQELRRREVGQGRSERRRPVASVAVRRGVHDRRRGVVVEGNRDALASATRRTESNGLRTLDAVRRFDVAAIAEVDARSFQFLDVRERDVITLPGDVPCGVGLASGGAHGSQTDRHATERRVFQKPPSRPGSPAIP